MSTTTITIRMDENLKKRFEALCDELGLNTTTAFTIFAKAVVRENGLPFALSISSPNRVTMQALEEVKRMQEGLQDAKTYSDVDEMMKELLS